MTTVEYTKSKGELLLTDYKNSPDGILNLRLVGAASGTLHLGNLTVEVKGGSAEVNISALREGVLTPFLIADGKSYICDKIKVKAGVVMPALPERERILYLTGKIIAAEDKLESLEERLAELCDAVYGKSIL